MNKNLLWKMLAIIGILLVFVFGIFGIPQNFSRKGMLAAITKNIHLGVDLSGRTPPILQGQVNDAVNVDSDTAIEMLKEQLNKKKIAFADITKPDPVNSPDHIVLKGVPTASRTDLLSIVQDRLPEYDITSGADSTFSLTMKPSMLTDLKSKAVTQAIETIRNRIDALGVNEPTIQEHGLGDYQILVQLPGIDDPDRVKSIIQSTAIFERKRSLGGTYPSEKAALPDKGGVLPPDAMLLPGHAAPGAGTDSGDAWYLLSRVSAVSGKDLRDAQPSRDQSGQPRVSFPLTGEGGQRFYNFTSAHVGDGLAVVLDGKVQEVANIHEAIRDRGEISGGHMSEQSSKDLSMILRSGALPAGIKYLNESVVGPSLGQDSINHGVMAAVIGMLAVLVFMLIYYRGAGINDDVALLLNLIILLGFMGYFGAVLTLPGIAG